LFTHRNTDDNSSVSSLVSDDTGNTPKSVLTETKKRSAATTAVSVRGLPHVITPTVAPHLSDVSLNRRSRESASVGAAMEQQQQRGRQQQQ
jgi:hypothetical protein